MGNLISIPFVLTIVGSTLSFVGWRRRSIVDATNVSQTCRWLQSTVESILELVVWGSNVATWLCHM